jgi:hypothetical protein
MPEQGCPEPGPSRTEREPTCRGPGPEPHRDPTLGRSRNQGCTRVMRARDAQRGDDSDDGDTSSSRRATSVRRWCSGLGFRPLRVRCEDAEAAEPRHQQSLGTAAAAFHLGRSRTQSWDEAERPKGQGRYTAVTRAQDAKPGPPSGGGRPASTGTGVMPHTVSWAVLRVPRLGWSLNEP